MPKKVYDGGAPEDLTPGVYSQISVDVDKMIDAAEGGVRNGEEKRVEEGKALQIVPRGKGGNDGYKMQQMQKANAAAWAKILPQLPCSVHEKLAYISPADRTPEEEDGLQELCKCISKTGDAPETAMRNLWGAELAKAPSRLRQALNGELALSALSFNVEQEIAPNGSVLPVPLNAKKSWGNKPEPSAYREYFEEYVALGDDRSADKVAEKFDLTHWQMNKICTEWCWVERIELIEHERALIQSIVRQDDVTAALQAVSIGMARELLQRVKVDEKTGMITGIKDLQFETKRDLERCVDMVLLIREKVFSDEQVANKPRGAGRLPAGGMGGRPVINFIIRK